ncbi:uncharacterized protein LOC106673251 [Cimex lectularius]|uniref:C2H2-type domain-containing protein n=1 Tax=Cimex lectularius TaxID=79782 RepID=A0A8I6SBI3_CIMLE|nr:uncharacterized protein LOC106673251 [Cimex lectularius]
MASALLHMSCTQLKNESVIGNMESDSYDAAYSELGRTKRDHDTDDMDRCQVKKRRKQSKPIRIASTESLPYIEVKSTTWTGLNQQPNQNPSPPETMNEDYLKLNENDHLSLGIENKSSTRNESDAEGSNEDNCLESFNHEIKREFVYPLNLSHTKSPSPKDSIDSFVGEERNWYKAPEGSPLYPLHPLDPTSLRNQVYQNNILIPSQAPGLVLPNFKRIFVGNNETQISSPHRIFNPEAFCDLCNKEFCNKYFLKTHKANKHGIYMENVSSNNVDNIPSLPMINYFSNNITNSNNLPMINYFSNNISGKKPTTPFPTTSTSKTNSSSMRAFCNICQREFCNKYFVRRHKAKIHGIIETTDESQEYKPQMAMTEKNEIVNEAGLPGPSAASSKPNVNNKEHQPNKDVNEVFVEEEKERIKKEQQENDTEMPPDSPQNALNILVSTWQSEESKESAKSPDRDRNKKPQISMGNSAFCDICCKEYCNKYFLRVHKQKFHGITVPEKDDRVKETNNMFWKSNQPMPLNLILRENNKSQPENEGVFSCNICNISFPEPYLLKMHSTQVHGQNKPQEVLQPQFQNTFIPIDQKVTKTNIDTSPQTSADLTTKNNNHADPILDNGKSLSGDVQKLHSMIMKLNQHTQLDVLTCDICNKEFGRTSSLENHIIKEHAVLLEEISNGFYEENMNAQVNANKFDCPKCTKYFPTLSLLEHHLGEKHGIYEPKINMRNGEESQDVSPPMVIQGERQIVHTPTSSFCEICKKELCNKYFMKTHMQRMHGISIENGAHIGGVVCDICNKELCSKYFLRVHKQNSHGIVEEAFLPQIGSEVKSQIANTDTALKPSENELTHRYFSHFTEVCTICSRRFRSVKWLKTHLLNDHGEEGKDKWREVQLQNGNKPLDKFTPDSKKIPDTAFYTNNFRNCVSDEPSTSYQSNESFNILNKNPSTKQYQCSYCSFSTSVLALLFVHERAHFPNSIENQELRCHLCMANYDSQDALELHINTHHSVNNTPNKLLDDNPNFNPQNLICEPPIDNADKDNIVGNDNNFTEISDSKLFIRTLGEACLKCPKCPYVTPHLETYIDHIKKEHKVDDISKNYFQIVRDALLQIANNSLVPASFAIPNNLGNFIMQPFVIEDKGIGTNNPSTFLSSLVFLPVKERLNKPVTASFKLTPT